MYVETASLISHNFMRYLRHKALILSDLFLLLTIFSISEVLFSILRGLTKLNTWSSKVYIPKLPKWLILFTNDCFNSSGTPRTHSNLF